MLYPWSPVRSESTNVLRRRPSITCYGLNGVLLTLLLNNEKVIIVLILLNTLMAEFLVVVAQFEQRSIKNEITSRHVLCNALSVLIYRFYPFGPSSFDEIFLARSFLCTSDTSCVNKTSQGGWKHRGSFWTRFLINMLQKLCIVLSDALKHLVLRLTVEL